MSSWKLVILDGSWTLVWDGVNHVVCEQNVPWGIAMDAATEFMDMSAPGYVYQPWVCNAQDAMRVCVGNAWRQR